MVEPPLKSLKGGGAAFEVFGKGWGRLGTLFPRVGPPLVPIGKKQFLTLFFQINGMAIILQKSVWDQCEAIFNSILEDSFFFALFQIPTFNRSKLACKSGRL